MNKPRGRGRGAMSRTSATPFTWASTPPTSSTGSCSRRAIVPNFAAAGRLVEPKTEPKAELKTALSEKKGKHTSNLNHLNSNRSRGRPKGKRAQREEQRIIQSEGVFSQGFGDEDKRNKLKNIKGEETVVGQLENSAGRIGGALKTELDDKKGGVVKRVPKREIVDTSNAFEEHWQSDEDLDKEELDELLRDGFISNLKKGSKMPFVLPSKDEVQFQRLINKKQRREEITDEEMEDQSINVQTANKSHETKFISAGDSLQHALSNGSSPTIFFQLPPTSMQPLADSRQFNIVAPHQSSSTSPISKTQRHCLEGLPTGAQIGKLQFLRSGRVVMNIGGQRMNVAEAIPSNCYETLLRIETESQVQPPPSASIPATSLAVGTQPKRQFPELNNGAPFVNPSTAFARPSNRFTNNAQLLGEMSGQFVCLFDVQRSSAGIGFS